MSLDQEGADNPTPVKEEGVVETAEENQMELSINSIDHEATWKSGEIER